MKNTTTAITRDTLVDAFVYWTGLPPRNADVALIAVMGRTVENTAQYIWDHVLLKPDNPSEIDVAVWVCRCEMRRRGDTLEKAE